MNKIEIIRILIVDLRKNMDRSLIVDSDCLSVRIFVMDNEQLIYIDMKNVCNKNRLNRGLGFSGRDNSLVQVKLGVQRGWWSLIKFSNLIKCLKVLLLVTQIAHAVPIVLPDSSVLINQQGQDCVVQNDIEPSDSKQISCLEKTCQVDEK